MRRPEYTAWADMHQRCYNSKHKSYANYGARGITVCSEWEDFSAFLEHIGPRPSRAHSLGRIDNNGNYEPGNVRWETLTDQNNNRRYNTSITAFGKTQTIAQWAKELGLRDGTLRERIRRGMSVERALALPLIDDSRPLEVFGETKSLTDWARERQIKPSTLRRRLARGWTVEDALSVPTLENHGPKSQTLGRAKTL